MPFPNPSLLVLPFLFVALECAVAGDECGGSGPKSRNDSVLWREPIVGMGNYGKLPLCQVPQFNWQNLADAKTQALLTLLVLQINTNNSYHFHHHLLCYCLSTRFSQGLDFALPLDYK